MILNQSAMYAVRAVLFLAQRAEGEARKAEEIADSLGVPRNYLGKVLHALVRSGVLTSLRGPGGGFMLASAPERLPLEALIAPFQELPQPGVCLLGDRPCNRKRPCGAHARWSRMSEPVAAFFRETTVEAMLHPLADREADEEMPADASPLNVCAERRKRVTRENGRSTTMEAP